MQVKEETREELQHMLESYTEISLWLASAKAAGITEGEGEPPFDIGKMSERLTEIRNFVASLPDCKEKLLIYYRYIRGLSMERVAELLGISLRSSYRIRLRALDFAAKRYGSKSAS